MADRKKPKIPTDAAATGRVLGHDSQSADRDDRYRKAWECIIRTALWAEIYNRRANREGKWLTYKDYAEALDEQGIATAQGGPWVPGTVKRVLKANGFDAKSFWALVKKRKPEMVKRWPQEAYKQWNEVKRPLDMCSPENGEWRPVLDVWPSGGRKNIETGRFVPPAPVELHEEDQVFQIWREITLGNFEINVIHISRKDTVTLVVPGYQLETFVWKLSGEERRMRDEKLRARCFRDDNAILRPRIGVFDLMESCFPKDQDTDK